MGMKSVKGFRLENRDQLFIYGEVLQDRNVGKERYSGKYGNDRQQLRS